MTGPGKGRYTDYVHPLAEQSLKLTRFHKNFNTNPMSNPGGNSPGIFYGATDIAIQKSNVEAAVSVTQNYVKNLIDDLYTSPAVKEVIKDLKADKLVKVSNGIPEELVYFTGNGTNDLPDTSILDVKAAASNSYMPVLISPGAAKDSVNFTIAFVKETDSRLAVGVGGYKPNLVIPKTPDDKENLGTLSPSDSSRLIGALSIISVVSLGTSKRPLKNS